VIFYLFRLLLILILGFLFNAGDLYYLRYKIIIGSTATKPDAAAQKTAQNKIDKYSKLASTHIFYLFAIETAGTWHEIAIELTQEIDRRITTITEDTWETTFFPTPFHCKEEMRFLSTTHHSNRVNCRCNHNFVYLA